MKPVLSLACTHVLPSLRAELEAGLERLLVGGDGLDHLEQRHQLRRVEEVEPDEPLRPLRRGRLVDHRERRGVGGEDGAVLDHGVDLRPHRELLAEVLGDRLDHEVAVGQLAVVGRGIDPGAHRIGVGLLLLALLDRPRQLLLDAPVGPLDPLVVALAEHDVVVRLGRDLGDPVAHQAAAQHPNLRHLH